MNRKGKDIVSDLMAEQICLGGETMTRAEAYKSLIDEGHSAECANYFAFHGKSIEGEKP
jgi:ketol-acid reductoisomerase